jgi:glycosyltransferase involved in cell wall biosynthesis
MPDLAVRVLGLIDRPLDAGDDQDWAGIDMTGFATMGSRRYGFSPGLLHAVLTAPADLIHVHGIWQFPGLAALIAQARRGTPVIVSPHGMAESWIRARSPALKAAVSRLYQNRLLTRAFAIHTLTAKEEADVAAMVGESLRCVLIPNFVEPQPAGLPPPDWWLPAYKGRDIYLFLGRLHEKKGCLELCEAWDMVCREDTGFAARSQLVFCGPSDGLVGFEERVAMLNARYGNALAAGPQYGEQKYRSFGVASFLCLPSKSEGLPMSVLEGWTAGVPTIMTPECNLPIGFARDAALVTTPEMKGIAATLREAAALSPDQRTALARNARALALDTYSPDAATAALAQLYRSAIVRSMQRK